jgi:hypothetical protein
MADNWYYAKGGQQQGPVSEAELKRLAEAGQLQRGDLVWHEGLANWQEAGTVPELFGSAPPQGRPEVYPQQSYPQQPQYGSQPLGYETPAQYQPIGYAPSPPPNYLVQAILTTICCCLPFGIVSIVYAAQVNTKFQVGDQLGAKESSDKARMWAWIAFGVGLLFQVLYFGFLITMAVLEEM